MPMACGITRGFRLPYQDDNTEVYLPVLSSFDHNFWALAATYFKRNRVLLIVWSSLPDVHPEAPPFSIFSMVQCPRLIGVA